MNRIQKIRDWLGATLVVLGMRIGGGQFAQFMVLVLTARMMRGNNIAAIELAGNGVVIHKHPEDAENVQPTTLH